MALAAHRWLMTAPKAPMVQSGFDELALAAGEVAVEVAGCGVCHTDLGFFYDGVRRGTRFPLTLGHEISGTRRRGRRRRRELDRARGRRAGGHSVRRVRRLPRGRGRLCPTADLPRQRRPRRLRHARARPGARPLPGARSRDAVGNRRASTSPRCRSSPTPSRRPTRRSRAAASRAGDSRSSSAWAASAASACRSPRRGGATVVAIDVDEERLATLARARRGLTLDARDARPQGAARRRSARSPRQHGTACAPHGDLRDLGHGRRARRRPSACSAMARPRRRRLHAGQGRGAPLEPDGVRRRAQGNWGCLPELYPAVVDLVLAGPRRARALRRAPSARRRSTSVFADAPPRARSAPHRPRPRGAERPMQTQGSRPRRRPAVRGRALRATPRRATPDGSRADGLYSVRITLDNPAQLNSYTTEMVKGVILGMRRASNDRARGGRRLHRRRRPRVLHRRQHGGVRRVLRRPSRGVPPVHAALQRHGQRDPHLRQAGDLPRQRHAHRRRPGDRHGVRLLGRAGPGALRAGRAASTARRPTAAAPTSCRCSSASRRAMESCTLCEPWSAHKALPPGASLTEVVPALQVDGRLRPESAGRDRPLDRRVRPHRLRRAQDRRRARRRARRCSRAATSTSRRSTRGGRARLEARPHDAGLPVEDDRERAQAQARALGPQPRERTAPGSRST